MKRIFKYPLVVQGITTIEMPKGARVLAVQPQYNKLQVWALINDSEKELEVHSFYTFGTGKEVTVDLDKCTYIGTYQLLDGAFVGHLYESIAR